MRTGVRKWLDWRRKRFWALTVLLAYALLGFFAAPWYIGKLAVETLEATGREAALERVRVNPFLFIIRAEGAEVRDPDGTVILSYDAYLWDFQLSSLFHWAWTFKEIRLDGLFVNEERYSLADSRLSRLIQELTGPEQAGSEAPEKGLPRIVIHDLQVNGARFILMDHTASDFQAELGPIDVRVQDLRTLPDEEGRQEISISTARGGRIHWTGTLEFQPFTSRGHLSIAGNGLADGFHYLDHFLPFLVDTETSGLELDYAISMSPDGLQASISNAGLEIDGLSLVLDSGDEPVTLERLALERGAIEWPARSVRFETLDLRGLAVHAALDAEGRLDLLDLVPGPATESGAPATGPAPTWLVELGELKLSESAVYFDDGRMQPAAKAALEGLALSLRGFDNRDGTSMPVSLHARMGEAGLGFEGQMGLLPELSGAGRLSIDGLGLQAAQPYVSQLAQIRINGGRLSLQGDLQIAPGLSAVYGGSLAIDELDLGDQLKGEALVSWQRLEVGRIEWDLAARSLSTSDLEFQAPRARIHIAEDLSTNVSDLFTPDGGAADDDSTGEGDPFNISIAGIRLADGGLDFSDYSLPLPFQAQIHQFNGGVSALATGSEEPAKIDMEGQVNEFGHATIGGVLDAWDITRQADIAVNFENLDLSRLTPYTIQFAGYEIDDGRIDLDLRYVLNNRKLEGANDIVIRDIVLGDKVEHPGAGNLPLGLAVALLTDSRGVIDIELPVSGDLDDPEFRIGGVILKALGNMITKLVTAPFRLLGSLVGIESEDFGRLGFSPGRADISPPDREQLVKLGEAMLQRPELVLEVNGVYDPEADRAALMALRVDAEIQSRLDAGQTEAALDQRRRVLEALASERLPDLDLPALRTAHTTPATEDETAVFDEPAYMAAVRERLIAAVPVSDEELNNLAGQRAQAVLGTLQAAQPAGSLQMRAGAIGEASVGDDGDVPMELQVSAGGS